MKNVKLFIQRVLLTSVLMTASTALASLYNLNKVDHVNSSCEILFSEFTVSHISAEKAGENGFFMDMNFEANGKLYDLRITSLSPEYEKEGTHYFSKSFTIRGSESFRLRAWDKSGNEYKEYFYYGPEADSNESKAALRKAKKLPFNPVGIVATFSRALSNSEYLAREFAELVEVGLVIPDSGNGSGSTPSQVRIELGEGNGYFIFTGTSDLYFGF